MGFRSAVGGTVWSQDTEPLSCNTPDIPVALSTKCTKTVQGDTQGYHPKSKTVKKVSKTKKKGSEPKDSKPQNGATGRTRTGDLLITNQLLYRLSHSSDSQALLYPIFRRMSSKFFSVPVKTANTLRQRVPWVLPNPTVFPHSEVAVVIDPTAIKPQFIAPSIDDHQALGSPSGRAGAKRLRGLTAPILPTSYPQIHCTDSLYETASHHPLSAHPSPPPCGRYLSRRERQGLGGNFKLPDQSEIRNESDKR